MAGAEAGKGRYSPTQEEARTTLLALPDGARVPLRAALGLLGQLTAEPCQIEPFHGTPRLAEVRACMRKQLQWHHDQVLRARDAPGAPARPAAGVAGVAEARRSRRAVPFPVLCICSPGRPEAVLAGLRFRPTRQPGVYEAAPALRLRLVVARELPRTRETLLLRLLGAGRVLEQALEDLVSLPDDALEKQVARPWLARFGFQMPTRVRGEFNDEEDPAMSAAEVVQAWFEQFKEGVWSDGVKEGRKEGRREGRKEGRKEGRLQVLERLFEKRLGRRLERKERAALAERLERLGQDRLDEVLLELPARALAAWIEDPDAT